jgi:hypothetical protein
VVAAVVIMHKEQAVVPVDQVVALLERLLAPLEQLAKAIRVAIL